MEKDRKLALLRAVPLFAGCSGNTLRRIETLADEIEVPAARELTREGESGHEFFIIVEGTVRIEQDGRELRRAGPGDFLGEISLIDHRPRTATATTETPTRLLVLGHREFHALLADSPDIAAEVMRTMAERIRALAPEAAP